VKKVEFDSAAKAIVVTRAAGRPSDEEIIRTLNGKGSYSPERIK